MGCPSLQRARGRAEIAVAQIDGRTRLQRLVQQGCAKLFLPRVFAAAPEAVLLNTSGGLTGGDHVSYAADVGPGAALTVTTQAAERLYRSTGDDALVDTRLRVGSGGTLQWLPQETILFDRARLRRTLTIDMAEDASLIALETIVLGRAAHGETVIDGFLSDRWLVRRGGRPVLAEALRLDGPIAEIMARQTTGRGATAMATLAMIAPDAEQKLDPLRERIPSGGSAAASYWDGILLARFVADNAYVLRRAVSDAAMILTGGPLPRVWAI